MAHNELRTHHLADSLYEMTYATEVWTKAAIMDEFTESADTLASCKADRECVRTTYMREALARRGRQLTRD